jgi:hypothetical protein
MINIIQHSIARTIQLHIYMAQFPFVSLSPCWFPFAPFCVPFVSPFTYLAPSSCDRNRPPPSQVACKLTPFAPPFTHLSHPLQIPGTPTAPRLTMTTSGIFRLLLSGTTTYYWCDRPFKNIYLYMYSFAWVHKANLI